MTVWSCFRLSHMHACSYLSYELCSSSLFSMYRTVPLKRYAIPVLIFFFLWSCFVKNVSNWVVFFIFLYQAAFRIPQCDCMLPLVHNTYGYLSLAVLRSCYSADLHALCSHSLTLLPCNSNRWFLHVWFAMAAKQKLVRRWSETRLFIRIAHCLRLLSLRV